MQTHKDLLDAPWVTPELKKAVLELERLQADQRVRDLYEARRDKQFLERTLYVSALMEGHEKGLEKGLEEGLQKGLEKGLQKGREEGLEKGLEKGREESAREIAMRLLRLGTSVELVMAATELPREDVEKLVAEVKGATPGSRGQ